MGPLRKPLTLVINLVRKVNEYSTQCIEYSEFVNSIFAFAVSGMNLLMKLSKNSFDWFSKFCFLSKP